MRKITFITVGLIIYAFLAIFIVTRLTPADFWLDVNNEDELGNNFNINYAFNKIYLQSIGVVIGSLTAFMIAQLLDVFIFQNLRAFTGKKLIWLRATGSTLISQLIDSFVVLYIAFYVFGDWTVSLVNAVAINNYIYKFLIAILVTPLIYLGHNLIDRYLGKENAEKMAEEASQDKTFF